MGEFEDWAAQFQREHGYWPDYDKDYKLNQQYNDIRQDYPNLTWEQLYYINNPGLAPRDYWGNNRGSSGGGGPAAPAYQAMPEVRTWQDWLNVYGNQPGEVDQMNPALQGMQSGYGAEALFNKFLGVAKPDMTPTTTDALKNRYRDVYEKYEEESGRAALAGAAPVGWHQYLTKLGPEGLEQQFQSLAPEQRGERPWAFNTRQRVQRTW